ncbi:unnamed protein product, partial [Mesorhabditis belari]|uniref:Uncharacterized protein n=1 Tax=Mesorhabditis belari TaxID=2138241 RepID=A0AAF3FKW7_9BILA
MFCDSALKGKSTCPVGFECAPNGVQLLRNEPTNGGFRSNGFRTRISQIQQADVNLPSSLRGYGTISYCRPIRLDTELDAQSFEESSWPHVRQVIGDPPEEINQGNFNRLTVQETVLEQLNTKSFGRMNLAGKLAGKGLTSRDLGFGQLQMAFRSQERALGRMGRSSRRKRSFWKKLGRAFKRFVGVALKAVTGFVRFGPLTIRFNG